MRPAYREPAVYYWTRQIMHNERLKDWTAFVAFAVWLGTLLFVGATT